LYCDSKSSAASVSGLIQHHQSARTRTRKRWIMNVKIIATRTCSHRPNLEKELQHLGIPYELLFVEDNPDVAARYAIRQSPTLVVNERVVCHGQPTEHELRAFFSDAND
jgi:glutaredoxin